MANCEVDLGLGDRDFSMANRIRGLLRKAGIEAYRYSVHTSSGAQLQRLLEYCNIDLVFDVGANSGHYASELRAHGFTGRIVSFEPLDSAHHKLVSATKGDSCWEVAPRMALGDADGTIDINVAGNSLSSSILDMLPEHERAAPGSAFIGCESVPVRRLDRVAPAYMSGATSVLLKVDTQGYEDRVLKGASGILDKVMAIQSELSLVPLYAGQLLFDDLRARLEDLGFTLYAIFPGYVHVLTGQTLQVDGYFVRKDVLEKNS